MELKHFFFMAMLLAVVSCKKENRLKLDKLDFDVQASATEVQVNKTVDFYFSGDAELLSFYSGEFLNDYNFKEGRMLDITGGQSISFTSAVDKGSQTNQLSVWASTDFDGNYQNLESIHQATWTDITNRFTLATTNTFVTSGEKDITDIYKSGKPLFIAYKYNTLSQLDYGDARIWMIQDFKIQGQTAEGKLKVLGLNEAGFRIIDENPTTHPARSVVTTSRITMQGNLYTDNWSPGGYHWAISKPLYLDVLNLGPDRAQALKGSENPMPDVFTHKFTKPGTYEVKFIGSVQNINKHKEIIKTITITVKP
ncbi:hypothetical protein Pedsa_1095 [Pseudopedobacter saltans DSM 12145]|uniref:DUF5017 domain-containing protein n=1 Tax=Pseudopedobacter saltans (strain ATCC 51119 / DSM 12145 / JCM 21818 / CCUG 39354 / LMG 10337 / NBRC 100064 / NCIMB 13643) TaxID=762903 RepID=F0SBL9_PSESL|nr:DUF5017 domain-containing protein [Pseudopedobacter saltans]ADY51665.1 hypothetical protein Pedsa_1095 [Pseudopedobacter saltans DSM 12145]